MRGLVRTLTSPHALHSLLLLFLSLVLIPINSALIFLTYGSRLLFEPRVLQRRRRILKDSSFQPRSVLITGVGTAKGLSLARLFYLAGHHVVGADVERRFVPASCGRFSKSVGSFHKLPSLDGTADDQQRYARAVVDIAWQEDTDIWISCSEETFAMTDALTKNLLEAETGCRTTVLDATTVRKMLKDHSFIQYTKSIGLPVPETRKVTSRAALLQYLADSYDTGRRYVLKYVGKEDTPNSDLILVPFDTISQTKAYVSNLEISEQKPWILQQYINGPEFWTYSLIIRGEVKAFVACPAFDSLTHYEALPRRSALSRSMLRFTQEFATERGDSFSGHISFGFLVDKSEIASARRNSATDVRIHPIKCSPHLYTAVCLFNGTPELIEAYLQLLPFEQEPPSPSTVPFEPNGTAHEPVFPNHPQRYYWIGQDLVQLVCLPLVSLLQPQGSTFTEVFEKLLTFIDHVIYWKEGVFEIWDPLPAWWFYHVQWPLQMLASVIRGRPWVNINVTTGGTITR